MARVPADLHIHLDNNVTKERVIKILKQAEENGLKAISLLEHNNLNFYKRGGVLEELLIEGIEQYYTGKIVTGIELNCTIKSAPVSAKTGIDYNGYDIHVMYYGFNPKELKRKVDWFNEEVDAVRYYSDVDSLNSNLRKLGLPVPPPTTYKFTEGVKPFKQLYKFIQSSPDKAKYEEVLGTYPHPSAFVRNLAYDPHSKIYFDRAQSPSIIDVINIGKECSKFQCISYPFHINRKLIKDVPDYIETLQSIPTRTPTKNFNCIEGPYMLNTDEETNILETYAKENGLMFTAGSDYQPQDQMYYLPPDATEKLWYAPAPGLYVRQLFDGGKGLLTIDEEFLALLPDVRDYKLYRTAAPKPAAPTTPIAETAIEEQPTQETPATPVVEEIAESAPTQQDPMVEPVVTAPIKDVLVDVEIGDSSVEEEEIPDIDVEIEDIDTTPSIQEQPAVVQKIAEEPAPIVEAKLEAEVEQVIDTEIKDIDVEIEDIDTDDTTDAPAEQTMQEAEPVVEEITEEIVEEPAKAEPEVEEAVEEVVEKKATPKPAKSTTKKSATKKPTAKSAKQKEEPTGDLDDTLSLLEKLTNDIE